MSWIILASPSELDDLSSLELDELLEPDDVLSEPDLAFDFADELVDPLELTPQIFLISLFNSSNDHVLLVLTILLGSLIRKSPFLL